MASCLRVLKQKFHAYAFLASPVRATCATHLILFDLIILIIHDEEYDYEALIYAVNGWYELD